MKTFVFFKALNLYIKLIDIREYIDRCKPLEQTENQKIILWLSGWIEELKRLINSDIIVNYNDLELLNELQTKIDYETIPWHYEKFFKLIKNLKYIPILPPLFTLKTMVQESEIIRIGDEDKIINIYFKTIPDFNFTEDEMVDPSFNIDISKKISKNIGGPIPTVLSMSVSYLNNPLMWPLIFHEYGHSVCNKFQNDPIKAKIWADVYSYADSKGLDKKNFQKWISEIFSDLYAIKCCGSNYLFAFYFHEILSRDVKSLLKLDKLKKFNKDTSHPPSYLRFIYIIKEINKYEFSTNDDLLAEIVKINKPFNDEINKELSNIDKEFYELFNKIYETTSVAIEKKKFDIDWDLIKNKLYSNLSHNSPIGTIYKGSSLSDALKENKEKFDIDSSNRINDIIYVGWRYLILGLFLKFYNEQSKYPIRKISNDNNKDTFTDDYSFLIKNINYSIETSVIVSNFKGV